MPIKRMTKHIDEDAKKEQKEIEATLLEGEIEDTVPEGTLTQVGSDEPREDEAEGSARPTKRNKGGKGKAPTPKSNAKKAGKGKGGNAAKGRGKSKANADAADEIGLDDQSGDATDVKGGTAAKGRGKADADDEAGLDPSGGATAVKGGTAAKGCGKSKADAAEITESEADYGGSDAIDDEESDGEEKEDAEGEGKEDEDGESDDNTIAGDLEEDVVTIVGDLDDHAQMIASKTTVSDLEERKDDKEDEADDKASERSDKDNDDEPDAANKDRPCESPEILADAALESVTAIVPIRRDSAVEFVGVRENSAPAPSEPACVSCRRCKNTLSVTELPRRVVEKGKTLVEITCKACNCTIAQLGRKFPSWPTADFKEIPEEDQVAFYDNCRGKGVQFAIDQLQHSLAKVTEEFQKSFNKSEFLPLSVWGQRGWDIKHIESTALPEDIEDRDGQLRYRVSVRSSEDGKSYHKIRSHMLSLISQKKAGNKALQDLPGPKRLKLMDRDNGCASAEPAAKRGKHADEAKANEDEPSLEPSEEHAEEEKEDCEDEDEDDGQPQGNSTSTSSSSSSSTSSSSSESKKRNKKSKKGKKGSKKSKKNKKKKGSKKRSKKAKKDRKQASERKENEAEPKAAARHQTPRRRRSFPLEINRRIAPSSS